VTKTELRITLAPQSSAHRTRAIAGLCEQLNRTKTLFPGSHLRLHFAIRGGFLREKADIFARAMSGVLESER